MTASQGGAPDAVCAPAGPVTGEVWVARRGQLALRRTGSRRRVPPAVPSVPPTSVRAWRRAVARGPHAWLTNTETVRLTGFGQPVTITRPEPTPSEPTLAPVSIGTVLLRCP